MIKTSHACMKGAIPASRASNLKEIGSEPTVHRWQSFGAKNMFIAAKNMFIAAKNMFITAKNMFITAKNMFITAKNMFITAKNMFITAKNMFLAAGQYFLKWGVNCRWADDPSRQTADKRKALAQKPVQDSLET
ncbi:hypothetical protein AGMMS49942_22660 [Spirochaetia bacterium]|nr:hypothetical protein AGMMS49942_22660 [Spirochaetia bacterium]